MVTESMNGSRCLKFSSYQRCGYFKRYYTAAAAATACRVQAAETITHRGTAAFVVGGLLVVSGMWKNDSVPIAA